MSIETTEAIAGRVRGLAAERRVTNAQIAEVLRVTSMSVSRRMSGQTPFTSDDLVKLARLFNVPIGEFFPDNLFATGSRSSRPALAGAGR